MTQGPRLDMGTEVGTWGPTVDMETEVGHEDQGGT